jgi:dTDP-4-dehydrorhamnose reductase
VSQRQPILVLGRSGQLAAGLLRHLGEGAVAVGRAELDLADPGADLEGLLNTLRPRAVVNAAAYTAVDRAETEAAACRALNRDAVGRLAEICARLDTPVVHISTDYVFSGEKAAPYVERDAPGPLNVYGLTKAEGELALMGAMLPHPAARWSILRTSWVFDGMGAGFLQTMLRLGATRDELAIVADQRGCPTSVDSLAEAAMVVVEHLLAGDRSFCGVVHAAGADDATWAEFASEIFAQARLAVRIKAIATETGGAPARRPKNSRLDCGYMQSISRWRPRPWREQLQFEFRKMDR